MTTFDCSGSRAPQPLHCHDEIEVVAVYVGQGSLQIGRNTHRTCPEMLAIVAPQEIHAGSPSTDDFAVCGFNFSTRLIADLAPDWEDALAHDGVSTKRYAVAAFQAAFAASQGRGSKMECDEWILRLFQSIKSPLRQDKLREKSRIAAAEEWLRANLAEDTSLPALASIVGVTPEYLCRAFRHTTGLPPHAYRSKLRVARAITFLRQGATASEAALAVGFYDQSHLTRHMRKQMGVTPGHFRKVNPVL